MEAKVFPMGRREKRALAGCADSLTLGFLGENLTKIFSQIKISLSNSHLKSIVLWDIEEGSL